MIASMSCSRRLPAASRSASGTSPSLRLPPSWVKARPDSRPTRPLRSCSSPIGRYNGGQPLPKAVWMPSRVRANDARSRSSLLMKKARGSSSSSAMVQTTSVWVSTPSTALTTNSTASAAGRAARTSPMKSA